jgi:hypothetical protein
LGDQKTQLKQLVQSHFHRFVGFQSAVKNLHYFMNERKEGGFNMSLANLQSSLGCIISYSILKNDLLSFQL